VLTSLDSSDRFFRRLGDTCLNAGKAKCDQEAERHPVSEEAAPKDGHRYLPGPLMTDSASACLLRLTVSFSGGAQRRPLQAVVRVHGTDVPLLHDVIDP
jgi:hypothetical protein